MFNCAHFQVKDCVFDFNQAVFKKVQELGLQIKYCEGTEEWLFIRYL